MTAEKHTLNTVNQLNIKINDQVRHILINDQVRHIFKYYSLKLLTNER